ncbi:olfactory receptor 1-like [Notolabrus celidotus]|uniref:olfactory receptor 1-like n=1 Tax=Notolabrus celidotus TaxID=1203425 RepID=UPI001490563D|nr:olfactory receptor 1-like [Notolabrus celidotus]
MEFFNSALGKNITFVRPAYFMISGFVGIPNVKYFYVFLLFIYFTSILGNSVVMIVIIFDQNLRTPKHIAVLNLVLVDLFGNTALVPKLLDIFLFNHPSISYNDCLTFLFFCFVSLTMQALNLVALSYDRLIAIIYPLHYHVKVTHRLMLGLIASLWLFAIFVTLIAVGLLTRLSFCKSVVIRSFFCDHGPLFKLSCNDATPSQVIALVLANVILWIPLIFILGSYCAIAYALLKITTTKERVKAFKTCTSHLSLVMMYFLPIIVVYRFSAMIHPNARIMIMSLVSVVPPMLNPIVYVLQTEEIKKSLKKFMKVRGQLKISSKN